jgi:hypothetical protein
VIEVLFADIPSSLHTCVECSKDGDCAGVGFEKCECIGFGGEQYCMENAYTPKECGDAYTTFWNCVEKNQCFPDTLFQKGTCIEDNCKSQAAKMITCQCDCTYFSRTCLGVVVVVVGWCRCGALLCVCLC